MSRANITPFVTLADSPSNVNLLNQNFNNILAALEKTVSRVGEDKNFLEGDIDANSKRIYNLPYPQTNTEPLRKGDIDIDKLNNAVGIINTTDFKSYITLNASVPIFAGQAVVTDTAGRVKPATHLVVGDGAKVLGISETNSVTNTDCRVRQFGDLTHEGWSFVPTKSVYLTTDGFLTQTVPTTGYQVKIGYAITSDKIAIHIETPIKLAGA